VDDYWRTFLIYTRSHKLRRDDGSVVPFVDEDLNPQTGEWWARALQIKKKTFRARGDHYNHSSYNDLIITGVAGLRPREDNIVEVHPLIPPGAWEWFCLDSGTLRDGNSPKVRDCVCWPTDARSRIRPR
jgi:hypothetical protein